MDGMFSTSVHGGVGIAEVTVLAVGPDGVTVLMPGEGGEEGRRLTLTRGLLGGAGTPPELSPGDRVLVWSAAADARQAVVLGRVGASCAEAAVPAPAPDAPAEEAVPDELVIEARKGLTLRVGDGSITIRADGRVLIKGRDLVSHATRTNRIRGGSVAIN